MDVGFGRASSREHRSKWVQGVGALGLALGVMSIAFAQDAAPAAGGSTRLAAGKAAYLQNCASCHGAALTDGQFAPPLQGNRFQVHWSGESVSTLDNYIRNSMPPANAGTLGGDTYDAILAYLLDANGIKTDGVASLAALRMPNAVPPGGAETAVGGLTSRHPVAPWPQPANPLASFKPVTEAELDNPDPQDWPAWRRSHLGQGFSPLKQIDTGNVGKLRVAWTQALPGGEATTEPLVRDGVLYMMGYGDNVFAFDAADGHQLWRYQRTLPKGTNASGKKTIALYGERLYAATSDNHVLALDARTGRPVWDKAVSVKAGLRSVGGPLVAKGVVMLGFSGQAPGGSLIAALDAETGAQLWTFNTIAQPGTPNGDSWNGVPVDKRSGGSVWTSGSFDPVTGLALWGTAQTYDTGPLRDRKPGLNNDALYTDTTLAFEPRSGKLVWYYQHAQNDQFDFDWVFERTIGNLEVKGKTQRVVMTAGKAGLFDALDPATGKYVKTVDMGYQNFITAIDPVTGKKTVDPDMIPDRSKVRYLCPHAGGGRNWMPSAYNQASSTIFVNARDICTDVLPAQGRSLLTTGISMDYAPPPNDDGRYGKIQALDMVSGKTLWIAKQRALYTMGMLATDGGLLFTGSIDRKVSAHDQATGKLLWQETLPGIPNGSPITYSVNGKQYVAVITGYGNAISLGVSVMTPEVQIPSVVSSGVYVFALGD